MTERGAGYPGALRLLWETVTGRRPVERSGPLLQAFIDMPAPLRGAVRWVLRPKRRFLFGRLRELSGDRVMSGPFAGMQLRGYPAAPELLGSYEHELFDVVRQLAQRGFHTVVNVGARYGYYAIGLARLMPTATVRAFEGDAEARGMMADAVRANGVEARVQVGGFCDTAELIEALGSGDGVLLVCDIDGGEVPLLDPVAVPALTRATMLVECHGPPETPTEAVMVMRFLPTHDVKRVATEERVLAHLPEGVAEPWRSRMPRVMEELMQEHRTPPQSWLVMMPRGGHQPSDV
ncbi:MAG: hypothetical protein P3B98_10780 [Gemmatimonadota bacterium]|nr:hypothetical protein [Gemmatimonadota bacterium]